MYMYLSFNIPKEETDAKAKPSSLSCRTIKQLHALLTGRRLCRGMTRQSVSMFGFWFARSATQRHFTYITAVESLTHDPCTAVMSAQSRQFVFQPSKPKLRKHTKSRKGCLACKARKVKVETHHSCIGAFMPSRTDANYGCSVLRLCRHVHTASGWTLSASIHTHLPFCQRHPAM